MNIRITFPYPLIYISCMFLSTNADYCHFKHKLPTRTKDLPFYLNLITKKKDYACKHNHIIPSNFRQNHDNSQNKSLLLSERFIVIYGEKDLFLWVFHRWKNFLYEIKRLIEITEVGPYVSCEMRVRLLMI